MTAHVETSLSTAGDHIRQLAFDGDPNSYFLSATNPRPKDHFTLVFASPVKVTKITVSTGRPKASESSNDGLEAGTLEVSTDARQFQPLAKFADGKATAAPERKLRAIRIRPAADLTHPLAIREFTIQSTTAVAVFAYPVEFIVDVRDAPELKDWADKVARICEQQYPMINEELKSPGFKPQRLVKMTLSGKYKGVAMASRGRITGSVKYFKSHPQDVGAMVHETVHIVQNYRTPGNPGWLVEGVADYIRFFKYEPGKLGRIARDPHYNGSYRTTAAFLNYVAEKYEPQLVRKLNRYMREGEYRAEVWRVLTNKTLPELDAEWRQSLGFDRK